jgi:hypothetical protein
MSKKTIDTTAITNELQGASLFFQRPTPSALVDQEKTIQEVKNVRTNERTNVRTTENDVAQTQKRVVVRHSFDVFEDQLLELQTLQLHAVKHGRKKPKLGAMVQRALDMYINFKKKETVNKRG